MWDPELNAEPGKKKKKDIPWTISTIQIISIDQLIVLYQYLYYVKCYHLEEAELRLYENSPYSFRKRLKLSIIKA